MRFVVSLHAAKAGGTSFAKYLLDEVSPELPVFCNYGVGHPRHGLHWKSERTHNEALVGESSFDEVFAAVADSETLVVHGHLSTDQLRVYEHREPELLMWFRDPLDRIRSHFDYWRLTAKQTGPAMQALFDSVKDGSCSIEEFGTHEFVANYYQRILGENEVDDLAAIGIVENSQQSLSSVAKWLGVSEPAAFPHVNRTDGSDQRAALAPEVRDAIANANAEDVAIYAAAAKRQLEAN